MSIRPALRIITLNLTRRSAITTARTAFSTTSTLRSPPSKMAPPEKKMKHLEAINAIPALYPDFRTVLWTGESSQLVVMTVPVGGDIGEEVSS